MTTETKNWREYERHALSALFGNIPDAEYEEMKEHSRQHPKKEMIALYEGTVIDGWHRYRIAKELDGPEPFFYTLLADEDPVEYVLGRNLYRRHLTASMRAGCVVACHEWALRGNPDWTPSINPDTDRLISATVADLPSATTSEMADAANASVRTTTDARTAERGGMGEQVRSGEMSASAAANQVRQQEREQRESNGQGFYSPPGDTAPDGEGYGEQHVYDWESQQNEEGPAAASPGETEATDAGPYESPADTTTDVADPEWVRVKYAIFHELEESKYELTRKLEELSEQISLLKETNSPDPETSQVVVRQRAVIRALESTNRDLVEERNELQSVVARQSHLIDSLQKGTVTEGE